MICLNIVIGAENGNKQIDMETRISGIEKKGAKIKPIDLISTSFFATINSAIIVVSLLLIMLFKSKMF
jgi:hypothetical protein